MKGVQVVSKTGNSTDFSSVVARDSSKAVVLMTYTRVETTVSQMRRSKNGNIINKLIVA